jgi:hypothetical protein
MIAIPPISGQKILLSGFADEASNTSDEKNPAEFFATFKRLGIPFWTPRFVWNQEAGKNLNITNSTDSKWVEQVYKMGRDEYGRRVIFMGSPVGKARLFEDDPENNIPYKSRQQALDEAKIVADNAGIMEASAIRGFPFYGKRADPVGTHRAMALDYLGAVAEIFQQQKLLFGIENEPYHEGDTGSNAIGIVVELRNSGLENAVLVPDLGNFDDLGVNPVVHAMRMIHSGFAAGYHVKANAVKMDPIYTRKEGGEHAGAEYVAVGNDNEGTRYDQFIQFSAKSLSCVNAQLAIQRKFGYTHPGVVVDLEPHRKGATPFGGWSGPDPDGFEDSFNGVIISLDRHKVGYELLKAA